MAQLANLKRPIVNGSIPIPLEADLRSLPSHIAVCLRATGAREVTIVGDSVEFRNGGPLQVSRWNVLNAFSRGVFSINSEGCSLEYALSCRGTIIEVTIFLSVFSAILFLLKLWQGFVMVPVFWVFIVGTNFWVGIPRFRTFAERVIANAPATGLPPLSFLDIQKGLRREHFL
jgi:hypothetical protein